MASRTSTVTEQSAAREAIGARAMMTVHPRSRSLATISALVFASLLPARSFADGAFPVTKQILLYPERPHDLLVATNQGLFFSNDDGASWEFVCESYIDVFVFFYQLGAAPNRVIYASTASGLAFSRNEACLWEAPTTTLPPTFDGDVFPDPTDASHVLVIANDNSMGGMPSLFESHDGGVTFGAPIY
jgi:hypothetical protein